MKDILKRKEENTQLLLSARKLIKKPIKKQTYKKCMNKVILQIKKEIPKDPIRKVCKKCFQIGHDSRSNNCPLNIEKKQQLFSQIKSRILQTHIFENMDEIIQKISEDLQITENQCKTLYSEISPITLLDRPLDVSKYDFRWQNCEDCGKLVANIVESSMKEWQNKRICYACWMGLRDIRDDLWNKIHQLCEMKCKICEETTQNFHFDHLNMFDKQDNICKMVDRGEDIQTILEEIKRCQIVCKNCHQIITDFEQKMGFTRLKTHLTKRQNGGEEVDLGEYKKIYEEKMGDLYGKLKEIFVSIKSRT